MGLPDQIGRREKHSASVFPMTTRTKTMKTSNPKLTFLAVVMVASVLRAPGAEAADPRAASPRKDALEWRYIRDAEGRLLSTRDPAGKETLFDYESFSGDAQRLQKITRRFPGGEVISEFDREGRLIKMTDPTGASSYQWDPAGRIKSVQRQGAAAIAYTHDTFNRVASVQIGDFYRIDYSYDFLGRIASMRTPAGLVTYEYRAGQGEVVRSLPNGVKTVWKRQPNGELSEITHGLFDRPDDKSYTPLGVYTYTHGPDGRIAAIRDRSKQGEVTRRYAYDTMGRLISATGSGGKAYTYAYDLVGNRVKATVTGGPDQVSAYDWAGRLTSVDGKPCGYDGSGNLTALTLNDVTRQYRYHPDGCIAEAQVGGESVHYRYDGFGRLVARKTTVGETRFVPDPLSEYWRPLVMEESGGQRTLIIWDGNTPLAIARDGQTEWLLHDHLGSVRMAADDKGNIKQQRQYDPFGVPEDVGQAAALSPGFAGLFWDGKANGYLTLARSFFSGIGSFLQPDPQKRIPSPSAEDCSLYTYCGSDPLNFADWNGKESEPYQCGYAHANELIDGRLGHEWSFENWRNFGIPPLEGNLFGSGSAYKRYQSVLVPGIGNADMNWTVIARAQPGIEYLTPFPHLLQAAYNLAEYTGFYEMVGVGKTEKPDFSGLLYAIVNISPFVSRKDKDFVRQFSTWPTVGERWQNTLENTRGYGIGMIESVSRDVGKPIASFLRQVDDFWCRPAYGDEISIDRAQIPSRSGAGGGAVVHISSARATPNEIAAYKAAGRYKTLSPSPVGGVYLGGAGGVIDGLGSLKGVRIDSNDNLVLVGEVGGDVKLPPLRLDDLVTVFRSVYLNGEGPTVTIDPNPENPEKSAMIIVHSEATKDTYVGWILYQADRLMKTYVQGVDNITTNDVMSRVPGYAEVLETTYFGAGDPRKAQKQGNWERFWIVPAAVNRYEGLRRELTILDVPLRVKTQKMKWESDKLVDDLSGESSPGALAFTSWFTKNYDGVSAEQYLLPPPESGITKPVPVFSELRQIALMTAVAEKLRDQEVPLPFWMRDYEVRKVPIERFTPGMEVTRTRRDGNTIRTARIFGGVELSPESKAVNTYATAADVAKAPPEARAEVDRSVKLAERLEVAISEAVQPANSAPLILHRVADNDHAYQAVAMPGATTLALNPGRLNEIDLIVPLTGGGDIRLKRNFNSFFAPNGPWGRGWTMDLPRLERVRVPTNREGGHVSYKTAYELLTPLNSLYARFKDVRPVTELAGSRLQVPDAPGPFHGLADTKPAFLKNVATRVLLLKDGQEWHFTERGELIAVRSGPQVTVYERAADGRVSRIVALWGGVPAAQIVLEYSSQGSLAKAVGTSLENMKLKSVEVSYSYDAAGRLNKVSFDDGTVGYGYKDWWITSVTWTDKAPGAKPGMVRSFDYNKRGQVVAESLGELSVRHSVVAVPGGVEASFAAGAADSGKAVTRYDAKMRPVAVTEPDGTKTEWTYKGDGSVETAVTTPDQRKVTVTDTPDGRQRTVRADGSPTRMAKFDDGGNLTTLIENDKTLLSQQWRPDGQLARVDTDAQTVSLQYGKEGLLSSVLVHQPKEGHRLTQWRETRLDRHGKPVEIKDNSGLQVQLRYDDSGALNSAVQKTSEGYLGYTLNRDARGRILSIDSTWDKTAFFYSGEGDLQRVERRRGGRSASVELNSGLVRRIASFDGGVTTFDYHSTGELAGVPKTVNQPNGLKLAHEFDDSGHLKAVVMGDLRRVRLGYDSQGRVTTYAVEPVVGVAR